MNLIVIIIIIMAVLAALIFAQHLSQKEKKLKAIMSQAKRMTQRADEIWDIAEKASLVIKDQTITDSLMDYYSYQITRRQELMPHADTQELIAKAGSFKAEAAKANVVVQLNNDQQINQAKRTFSQASKALRSAMTKKVITTSSCNAMRNALRRRLLDLEVAAYERLGDAAGEKNDPALATNYYKYAKKILIESDLKFEGKNELVRSITKKTQILFGNIVDDQLSKKMDSEAPAVDEFGIPNDVDVLAGNKKKF